MRGGLRKPVTFRFDSELLERARRHASADNRSLTNYVETAVLRALEHSDEMPERRGKGTAGSTEQEGIDK